MGQFGGLQKSAEQLAEHLWVGGEELLIFRHLEQDLPNLWDFYEGTIAVGANGLKTPYSEDTRTLVRGQISLLLIQC